MVLAVSWRDRRARRLAGGLATKMTGGVARSDFGLGLLASLAILELGISLDRITRGARQTQQSGSQ